MINLYFDLDDAFFDFSGPFLKFVNNILGKQHRFPEHIDTWSAQEFYGIDRKTMDALLDKYSEEGRFFIQPPLPGALRGLKMLYGSKMIPKVYSRPYFITARQPVTLLHTLSQLQNTFKDLGFKNPADQFNLIMANNKYQLKWKIIKELNRFADGGIFIDDHPDYINDVTTHCPNTITIWFNRGYLNDSLSHPHYLVKSWEELGELLLCNFDILIKNSNHKHVWEQLEIA